jgi:hypothetical protein
VKVCHIELRDGENWCHDCKRFHRGHTLAISQELTEEAQKYRDSWRSNPLPETYKRSVDDAKLCLYLGDNLTEQEVDSFKSELLAGGIPCKNCNGTIPGYHCSHPTEGPFTRIAGRCTSCVKYVDARMPFIPGQDYSVNGLASGKLGVVIGSYGMPGVVELSIAMIRKTCGDVPILIADDCTPESMGRQRLLSLPAKYPGVSLHMSGENLGHAPGDIRAYRNGLRWAKKNGIEYICKLSQRFIFLSDRWLQQVCDEMRIHGYATSSQRAVHLHMQFAIRSECVFMDVKQYTESAGLMSRLDPPGGKIPTSAEDWLHAGINEGRLLPVMRCRLMPVDRFGKHPSVLWHNSDSSDDYHEKENKYTKLAAEMGIDLGPEFSGAGWHVISPHRPDANYKML